jgi:hypothetical protein
VLLLRGAEGQDGRRGHAQADPDPPRVVVRRARRRQLGVGDRLQGARRAQAAEAGRVVHPGQARVEPGAQEVERGRGGGVVRGQQVSDPAADVIGPGRRAARLGLGQHSGPPAT